MVAAEPSLDTTVPAEDQGAGAAEAEPAATTAAAPLDIHAMRRETALHNLSLLSTEALISLITFAVWILTADEDDENPPDLLLSDDDADQLLRAIRGLAIIQQVLGDEEVGGL